MARPWAARVRVRQPVTGRARPASAGILSSDEDLLDAAGPWLQPGSTRRDVHLTGAWRHPATDGALPVDQCVELTGIGTASVDLRPGGRWWTPPTPSGVARRHAGRAQVAVGTAPAGGS